MLRPATPLSILFFVAFVLLLISTITTPVVKSIPLSSQDGFDYGVFGFCNGDSCTFALEYDNNLESQKGFELSPNTRHSLTAILIIHPIAAFFTLICTGLAIAAHFRGPSHSARFLLGLLIFSIPTMLAALLAFLVDILLFIPHLEWAGWIVLAATIIICASSVLTCAMRRTLVSRKARKRRIAENNEMNGSIYYASKPPQGLVHETILEGTPSKEVESPEAQFARAESPPPVPGSAIAGAVAGAGAGAGFATFESRSRPSNDDRTPLNARDPSVHTTSSRGGASQRTGSRGRPGAGAYPGPPYDTDGRVSPPSPAERDYGGAYAGRGPAGPYDNRGPGPYGDARQPRDPRGPPGGGYGGGQGRGYPPQQRGAYGRGAPQPYGGPPGGPTGPAPGGPYRGGYGPRGRGGAPSSWNQGQDRGGLGMAAGAAVAGGAALGAGAGYMMSREHGQAQQQGPPPGYGPDYYVRAPPSQSQSQDPYGAQPQPQSQPGYNPYGGTYGGGGGAYNGSAPASSRPSMEQSRANPYGYDANPSYSSVDRNANDRPAYNFSAPQPSASVRSFSRPRNASTGGSTPASRSGPPGGAGAGSGPYGNAGGAAPNNPYGNVAAAELSGNGAGGEAPRPYAAYTGIGQAVEMDAMSGSPSQSPPIGSGPPVGASGAPAQADNSRYVAYGGFSNNNTWAADAVEIDHHRRGASPAAHAYVEPVQAPTQAPVQSLRTKTGQSSKRYVDTDRALPQLPPMDHPSPMTPGFLAAPGQAEGGYGYGAGSKSAASSLYDNDEGNATHGQAHGYGEPAGPVRSGGPGGLGEPARPRSPAHSDASHFTSISQRGVNPAWPGPGAAPDPTGIYSPPRWQRQDALLQNNPDFVVPGAHPGAKIGHQRSGSSRGAAVGRPRAHSGSNGALGSGPYPESYTS